LVEGLRQETSHLGITTLLIEPGFFRTKFLNKVKPIITKIPEYEPITTAVSAFLAQMNQTQRGDPAKAVDIIIDLVKKEGCAADREIPFRLPLGTDCYDTIKEKAEATLKLLQDWESVIKNTDYPK
jgi:hypothetical protein